MKLLISELRKALKMKLNSGDVVVHENFLALIQVRSRDCGRGVWSGVRGVRGVVKEDKFGTNKLAPLWAADPLFVSCPLKGAQQYVN